jgi:hypothetical protein
MDNYSNAAVLLLTMIGPRNETRFRRCQFRIPNFIR